MNLALKQLVIRIGAPSFGVEYGVSALGTIAKFSKSRPALLALKFHDELSGLSQRRVKRDISNQYIKAIALKFLAECREIETVVIRCGAISVCESR